MDGRTGLGQEAGDKHSPANELYNRANVGLTTRLIGMFRQLFIVCSRQGVLDIADDAGSVLLQ